MKKAKRFAAVLSAAAIMLSANGIQAFAEQDGEKTIPEIVASMTTEEKIEQMIMITLRTWKTDEGYKNVTSLNQDMKRLIEEHDFGGICLYGQNIADITQTVGLTNEIQAAALSGRNDVPMMICCDQEGGSIYRLGTGTPTCGNMALGAALDPELAEQNAGIIGKELRAVGFNTDFAPVLDVNNNPSNPVINIRSFSSDADIVSRLGAGYIAGLKSQGIITTSKHFPGHGDTNVDSHSGLPLIDKSYDELKQVELVPYNVNTQNSDMIMTAHIQFPKIETNTYDSKANGQPIYLPATLSKTFITDILRGDYNFGGVAITDSMVMDAIAAHFDPVDAAVLAMNADVDIILEPMTIACPQHITDLENYIAAIAAKVNDGTIPMETIDRSVTRILTLKQQRGVLDYTPANAENALKIVGSAENRETALQIARKAVTLVKNDNDLLPLDLGADGTASYFYPYDNVENTMKFALDRLKKEGVVSEGVSAVCRCYQDHEASEFEETVKNSDVVIVSLEMYRAANIDKNNARGWQALFCDDIIGLAHKHGKKVVYLSANIPYDVARFPEADAIVAVYNADGMDELPAEGKETAAYGVNYPAGLITIFGGSKPTGKLPVDVYKLDENSQYTDEICYPCGYGLSYSSTIRVSGSNRFGTAAEIAKTAYPYGTDTVVLANGRTFADALAGGVLADKLGAPILLTEKDSLPRETTNAIEKLGAKKVVILGGSAAVSADIEKIIKDNGITTERVSGKTRSGTAAAIAGLVNEAPTDIFFVYAKDYPDALSASSAAAAMKAPILYLSNDGELDADTARYLASLKEKSCVRNAYVIGGNGVISDDMKDKAAKALGLETATRVSGKNRYLTNIEVNKKFADKLTGKSIYTATGRSFPDALAGGVFAAQKAAPILLTSDALSEEQTQYLADKAAVKIFILGGKGAVSDEIAQQIADASRGSK